MDETGAPQFDRRSNAERGLRVNVDRVQASPDTNVATVQTVVKMGEHIRSGAADPVVRSAASVAVKTFIAPANVPAKIADVWACWWWVKHNVRFVPDEDALRRLLNESDQLELLISPAVLVRMPRKFGDCDDFTMLVLAMLASLGHTVEIVTVAAEPDEPWRFSHVFGNAVIDGERIACDVSHGAGPGWQVPAARQFKRATFDLTGAVVNAEEDSMIVRSARRRGVGFLSVQSPITGSGGSTGGWAGTLQQLALQGGNIFQQLVAPLKPGEYVQTGEGVRSRQVPGAVPGIHSGNSAGVNVGVTGISTGTIVIVGLGLVAAMAVMARRN